MNAIVERILLNTPDVDDETMSTLRELVTEVISSGVHAPALKGKGIISYINALSASGKTISIAPKEGLPAVDDILGNLTALEIIGYWHPNPAKRLQANRLLRKLDLNVTDVCNYDCSYCYQRSRDDDWEKKAIKAEVRESSFAMLLDLARQANVLGTRRVKITGGEPLTKRGIFDFIRSLLTDMQFDQVELCTNGSLIKRHQVALQQAIDGNAERFHIHTSIDGISQDSLSRTLTKASPAHLQLLKSLLENELKGVSVSVNTMWNPGLLKPGQLDQLYDFVLTAGIERWTISFPYFVRDFIEACKSGEYDELRYDEVVSHSAQLVERHMSNGMPFLLSIPLVFKQEMFSPDGAISETRRGDHPCFPCHGSFFVIGPEGDLFDCLLCDHSKANVRTGKSLFLTALDQSQGNPYYDLTVDSTSIACRGCRYERLCHGQCPNDRLNTSEDPTRFSRDKSACSLLAAAETEIWKKLPQEYRDKVIQQVVAEGFTPARYASPGAIARGEGPLSPDLFPGKKGTGIEEKKTTENRGRPASAIFHRKAK